eukprot:gene1699-33102_t
MATSGWGGAWNSSPENAPAPDVEAASNNAATDSNLGAPLYASEPPAQQATTTHSNPFAGNYSAQQHSEAPPPDYSYQPSGNAGAYSNSAAVSNPNKEAELSAREAAVKKKQAELDALEREITAAGGVVHTKNWPVCYPLIYHDINAEIPPQSIRVVKEVYWSWYGLVFCLSWNWFCACVILGSDEDGKVSSWFLAAIYWLAGIPLGFILWYRKLYNGAKAESSFSFMWFFAFYALNIAFCIWSAVGVPFSKEKWSFAGFIVAIAAFDVNLFAGVVYMMGASFWSIQSVYCLWCMKDVFLFFRGKGGVEQAKQQVFLFFRGKGGVQQAKQEVAMEAFKQSMARKT